MRLVIDTSAVIAEDVPPLDAEGAVASVTYAELAYGLRTAKNPVEEALRRARLERTRQRLGPGLPFGDEAADAFGLLAGLMLAAGLNPRARSLDLMIAATAYTAGAGVFTRNPVDFAPLQALVPVLSP